VPASPLEHYRARLAIWQSALDENLRRFRQLSTARLAVGLAGVVIAALSLGAQWLSPWWLLAPLVVFMILAVIHEKVDQKRSRAARAVAYCDRARGRMEHKWASQGNHGERFRPTGHLYCDDLDVLGEGSLFALLDVTRTEAGQRTLARWLLEPCETAVARKRQKSVMELAPRWELREEIALLGDDVRAAIDDKAAKIWGAAPVRRFFPGVSAVALLLALAAIASFALFMAQVWGPRPFLAALFVEMVFGLTVRDKVKAIVAGVSAPGSELRLLGELLARLEQEHFQSPMLNALARGLEKGADPASTEIRRLQRWVERLDWARNQFFRGIAAPLLWIPQCAFAIEKWRERHGPRIAGWVNALAEFEALSCIATFAYEQPGAVFPEFVDGDAYFSGTAVRHPLIDPPHAVANDVELHSMDCRLWLVSGSNMSGKSTLLRAVGLNAVLAWAGAPVCCQKLRLSPLRIGASLRVNDSLLDNKSRFYAEISRLRDVAALAKSGQPTLFLLDELLSGTNSHDRRIGAAALVKGLVERGAIGLVTTHDLALASIAEELGGQARNVHFEDHMEGGEMRFDYQLRPGVVERSNALELMRAVGLDV